METMSSLLTLWDYHTGTAITLVGSAMLRTSLHAPLEKGTRKFVWKSKNLKSSLMKSAWQTHGVIMPFSNWATSQAKNVRGDPLHILICKGLYGHVLGSILHYACYIEGPGKRAIKKPADRLAILFSQIQIQQAGMQKPLDKSQDEHVYRPTKAMGQIFPIRLQRRGSQTPPASFHSCYPKAF